MLNVWDGSFDFDFELEFATSKLLVAISKYNLKSSTFSDIFEQWQAGNIGVVTSLSSSSGSMDCSLGALLGAGEVFCERKAGIRIQIRTLMPAL